MSTIIVIFLALIAIAGLFELRRRNAKTISPSTDQGSYVTAAESGPTETGRYRVEQMLNVKANLRPGTEPQSSEDNELEADTNSASTNSGRLPDPFAPKS